MAKCINCGKKLKLEQRKYCSRKCTGQAIGKNRRNISSWNKGLSKENDERLKIIGRKISFSRKGIVPWNKNKVNIYSREILQRMSKSASRPKPYLRGKNNGMYGRIGKLNPNWRGGLSYYPYHYSFNKLLKRNIKIRDNYTCQFCGKYSLESNSLDIHHIDYDKSNSNSINLITLCKKCNTKVNFNRIFWEKFLAKRNRI